MLDPLVDKALDLAVENARLRAALRPLAEAADEFGWIDRKGVDPESTFLWICTGGPNPRKISVGDALRARDALGGHP